MLDNLALYTSLLINFVVIAGWIVNVYVKLSRKSTVNRVFGSQHVTIYFPTRDGNRRHPLIASEDFRAANTLADFLRDMGVRVKFASMPRSSGAWKIGEGAVVICGPKSSEIVRSALEKEPHYRVHESTDGVWRITEIATETTVTSPLDKDVSTNRDVAYVGRLKMDPHDSHYVLVIAGIHAIGSLGAVHYLSNMHNLKRLWRETKGGPFSMIVASKYDPETMEIHGSSLLMPIRQH